MTECLGKLESVIVDPGGALAGWFESFGFRANAAGILSQLVLAIVVLIVAVLVNWVTRRVLASFVHRMIRRTRTRWDDILLEREFFARLSHLAPALVIYASARLFPDYAAWVTSLALAYMTLVGLGVTGAFLDASLSIYQTYEVSRHRPLRGYFQALKVFVYVLGGIAVLGTLIHESPWKLLSGIGALTAIILLVFKDSILGFVASIQISVNDMVRIGDWIEMPKYGADGDVVDITLQCVKVCNWDKTITTIPTYALVSDSFKNWRGMKEAGGRRIKRAVYLDMNSVRFVDDETQDRFARFAYLGDYLERKQAELDEYNRSLGLDLEQMVNGRRLTNIGTFRAYVREYLRNHPRIRPDMTLLVRHLPPTEHGLPIELYAFAGDTRWAEFEDIQADIFDHILAVLPEFGLRAFQRPSGRDLDSVVGSLRAGR